MSGINYKESRKLRKVPQMSPSETINYYAKGEVPERFTGVDEIVNPLDLMPDAPTYQEHRDSIVGRYLQ